ncbi:hypothetical protein MM221_04155 [Salipaludibacillus sp. LMS25]|uniref:hypothetical protein n=1 Tax=Salipaludibacillus sp. LMS25 TaxID=2924031 RepID=UPI0020D0D307|nr:hypothetical protein [Salipaludibacillus sp. LMS25]UTR15782.1 hypothetical protein MM221_04155 [Salipaludibacillus sp. LMS25]
MNELSLKELTGVEDEVRTEEILAKTINWCASQCEDPEIRGVLEGIAEQHQLRVADISQYFNRSRFEQ